MRYEIKSGQVVESMFIDAPYDTKADALEALNEGVIEYTKTMWEPDYIKCSYCDTIMVEGFKHNDNCVCK